MAASKKLAVLTQPSSYFRGRYLWPFVYAYILRTPPEFMAYRAPNTAQSEALAGLLRCRFIY